MQSLKLSFNKFKEANVNEKVKICIPFTLKLIFFIESIIFLSSTVCIMETFDAFEYLLLLMDIIVIIANGFYGFFKHNHDESKWYVFFLYHLDIFNKLGKKHSLLYK
jgi:hypothetical protein